MKGNTYIMTLLKKKLSLYFTKDLKNIKRNARDQGRILEIHANIFLKSTCIQMTLKVKSPI